MQDLILFCHVIIHPWAQFEVKEHRHPFHLSIRVVSGSFEAKEQASARSQVAEIVELPQSLLKSWHSFQNLSNWYL
jgi:hypothetical protein